MRFCVPIPCFFSKIPFRDAVARISALGVDAAETYQWKNLNPEEVRAACAEYGVDADPHDCIMEE